MKANANALKKQLPSPLVLLNFEYLVLRSYSMDYDYTFFSKLKMSLLEFLADKWSQISDIHHTTLLCCQHHTLTHKTPQPEC